MFLRNTYIHVPACVHLFAKEQNVSRIVSAFHCIKSRSQKWFFEIVCCFSPHSKIFISSFIAFIWCVLGVRSGRSASL